MLHSLLKNGPIKSITAAAAVVAFASFISRILGLFRDHVLAGQFGAGEMLDVYYAAFRIPDFLFNMLILGGLSAAFIPLLASYLGSSKQDSEAFDFANNILTIGGILIVPIVAAAAIVIPFFVAWFVAPGFSAEQQALTSHLSRIMLLSPILLGISGIVSGILQSYKRFFVYSLAPIFYNFGIIIGALYFTPHWGIAGLAWGVVFGAFMHLGVQVPAVYALGYRFRFVPRFHHAKLKKFIRLAIPRTFNLIVVQLNLLILTFIASHLQHGSITVFNFANNLQSFPIGIIGVSFAVAAFPTLAQYASGGERKKFLESFSKTVTEILFFVLPLTVFIITLRAQIVRVVLGTGAFDWEDTIITFQTLGLFSISLFAQSLVPLLARAFYALKNTTTPFLISLCALVGNVFLSVFFAFKLSLGVPGLALAFSLASVFQLMLLWFALRVHYGYLNDWTVFIAVFKMVIASSAMVPLIQITKYGTAALFAMDTFMSVFTQGFFSVVVGGAVYVLVSMLLKLNELAVLGTAVKRRFVEWRSGIDISAGREV